MQVRAAVLGPDPPLLSQSPHFRAVPAQVVRTSLFSHQIYHKKFTFVAVFLCAEPASIWNDQSVL